MTLKRRLSLSRIRLSFLVGVIAAPILANPLQSPVVNAVVDMYRAFPEDQEKLGGIIGSRLRANSEGYIEHVPVQTEAATAVADSNGQRGTLLDAAAYSVEYSHDPSINAVMNGLAKKLITEQAPDGSFGVSAEATQWTEEDTRNAGAAMVGLLHYYRITGDQSALASCTKLGNLLVKQQHKSSGDDAAMFATALEPMALLYRFSDNNAYLDFCNKVASAWLHKKPPELAVTDENLAVLNGLVELYRLTGDNTIFKAPLQAWTEMSASGFTITGVPADESGLESPVFSACGTSAWLQLTYNLFRISGQAIYAEQFERTIYNQLFAAQDPRTGSIMAPVLWGGKKQPSNNSACAATEVRALAMLPSFVWGRYGNGVAVNLYTNGRMTVKLRRRGTIQLYSETNYPDSGTVQLHVEPDHPIHFPLRLRVPDWASKFTADVGGDHFVGKAGEFLILNRGWKRGDTVQISMAMTTRTIPGIKQFSADIAIARGPELLALGTTLNPAIKNFDEVAIDNATSSSFELVPMASSYAANWMGEQTYEVQGTYKGQPQKLTLVPFADAMNYRIWLAQPKASAGASSR